MLKAEPCLYPQFSLKPSGVSGNVYWAQLTSGMLLAISWGVNQCCHWDQRFQACWWLEAYNHVLQVKVLKQSWPGFISFGEFKKKNYFNEESFFKNGFYLYFSWDYERFTFHPQQAVPTLVLCFQGLDSLLLFFFFFFFCPQNEEPTHCCESLLFTKYLP